MFHVDDEVLGALRLRERGQPVLDFQFVDLVGLVEESPVRA